MKDREDTGRVIAVAIVFLGGLAVLGALSGVYERLSQGTCVALAVFAAAYAIATYALDRNVRAYVDDWMRRKGVLRPAPRPSPEEEKGLKKAAARSPAGSPAAT